MSPPFRHPTGLVIHAITSYATFTDYEHDIRSATVKERTTNVYPVPRASSETGSWLYQLGRNFLDGVPTLARRETRWGGEDHEGRETPSKAQSSFSFSFLSLWDSLYAPSQFHAGEHAEVRIVLLRTFQRALSNILEPAFSKGAPTSRPMRRQRYHPAQSLTQINKEKVL